GPLAFACPPRHEPYPQTAEAICPTVRVRNRAERRIGAPVGPGDRSAPLAPTWANWERPPRRPPGRAARSQGRPPACLLPDHGRHDGAGCAPRRTLETGNGPAPPPALPRCLHRLRHAPQPSVLLGCVSVRVSGAQTKGRSASTAAASPVRQRQTESTGDPALANATLPAPRPAILSESSAQGSDKTARVRKFAPRSRTLEDAHGDHGVRERLVALSAEPGAIGRHGADPPVAGIECDGPPQQEFPFLQIAAGSRGSSTSISPLAAAPPDGSGEYQGDVPSPCGRRGWRRAMTGGATRRCTACCASLRR